MNQVVKVYLAKYKPRLDKVIETELARRLTEVTTISPHLTPVIEAMQELARGGKRMRGILTVLGYELAGKKVSDEIIKAGAVMELFHLGLLVQDDVMDEDKLRRGVTTLHTRYDKPRTGENVAICAGDLTFGWGMETIAGLALPMDRLNKAISLWGHYFARVGYGQILDTLDIADEQTILDILSIKSGEYSCVLPLTLGSTLAGADEAQIKRLAGYGMELGLVFQLRDDWLGMWGDTSKTGKPAGEQKGRGKRTYATLYGRDKTEEEISEHWQRGRALANGDRRLLELLEWVATREN